MNSTSLSSDLAARLQEKLDSAVLSPVVSAPRGTKKVLSSSVVVEDDSRDHKNQKPSGGRDDASSIYTYRDYSQVGPDKSDGASSLIAQSTTAKEPTFPVKLHMILSNPEFQDIISWLPHGRSWRILQQKAFEERVIPLYFRHGRYSSFARQVNGWGFRRVTHGSDYNSYYHEMFLRGMPHLCEKMRRLTNKDTAARKKLEDEPAPDFYALSRSHPLPESTPMPAPAIPASMAPPGVTGGSFIDMEAALLERRRADLVDRMNLLASTGQIPRDMSGMAVGATGLGSGYNGIGGLNVSASGPASILPLQQFAEQFTGGAGAGSPDVAQFLAMNSGNRGMGMQGMGAAGMASGMVTQGMGGIMGGGNPYGL